MTAFTVSDKVRFIESVFGSGRIARNAKNMEVRCPICAPKDPNKKKLAILIEDDRNHCWTCGWRARTLVPLLKKYSTREKLLEYAEKFLPHGKKSFSLSYEQPEARVTLPDDFRLIVLAHRTDPDAKAVRKYLEERGLTQRDLWYYRIGVSDSPQWSRRAIVPSFDSNGSLNYFVGRAIDSRRRPKYDNPDVKKTAIIFNELNVDWTKKLVLCEGVFDMFKCGENVVPLLGSDINEESALFNAILVNETEIALALDSDMWETKTLTVARKLSEYNVNVSIVDTRPFSDPGNATKEQFAAALASAKEFDWMHTFSNRLNRASRVRLG